MAYIKVARTAAKAALALATALGGPFGGITGVRIALLLGVEAERD